MYIAFKRICEVNAPFELVVEAGNDWTHFTHLHRRSHLEFRMLYKEGHREIFLYKAKMVHFLPFFTPYLVFREYVPAQFGYRQIYLDLRKGRVHYLNGTNEEKNDSCIGTGEFWFEVSWFWRFFPKLFFWLFRMRMRTVMSEDNVMIRERMENGGYNHSACAPPVPEQFDFFNDLMEKGFPKADFFFSDHAYEDLRGGKHS